MSHAMRARRSDAAPIAKGATRISDGGLRAGKSGDAFEREADPAAGETSTPGIAGPGWSLSRMNIEPRPHKGSTQAAQRHPGNLPGAPPIVREVLRSPGRPLEHETRAYFESRFGRGLGGVRVHADAQSSAATAAINSHAFTVGNDVVLGDGACSPRSLASTKLLAHELTHVLQADAAAGNPTKPSSSVDMLEREARLVAAAFEGGGAIPPVTHVARDLYGHRCARNEMTGIFQHSAIWRARTRKTSAETPWVQAK